jgi:ABC-2 type transport system permease protein
MNIIRREIRANLISLLVWSVAGFILVASGMLKYETFKISNPTMEDISDMLPQAIRVIFGFGTFDLTTVSGYYGMMFLYFLLVGTIHAVMLGAVIISKEERDKTADFIFVKPLKRRRIVTFKLIAGLINLFVLNLIILFTSIFYVAKYQGDYSLNNEIFRLMIALLLLQILFFFVGTGISALTFTTTKALSIATGIMLGTYLLSIVIDLYDKISFLKYLTPFKYFEAKQLMYGGTFQPLYLVLTLGIIILSIVITYRGYERHDFHV